MSSSICCFLTCIQISQDSDAGRDWGQDEKGTTEDEMAGWHHWLDGRESQWTLGVGDGQGGLACCDSWGRKKSDTTERLIWYDLIPEWPRGFHYFFQFMPEFYNKELMTWATVSSILFLLTVENFSIFDCKEYNQSDVDIDHLLMSMCRVVSYGVESGCLLWPVNSLGKTLLAFVLLHFVLQGQTCLLL